MAEQRDRKRPDDTSVRPEDEVPPADEDGVLASGAPEPAPAEPVHDESSQTYGNDLARKTGGGSG